MAAAWSPLDENARENFGDDLCTTNNDSRMDQYQYWLLVIIGSSVKNKTCAVKRLDRITNQRNGVYRPAKVERREECEERKGRTIKVDRLGVHRSTG